MTATDLAPVQEVTSPSTPPARKEQVVTIIAVVCAHLALATELNLPVIRPVLGMALLLGLPTLVLARRAGLPGDTGFARSLYAFGLTLLGVLVLGLGLNTVLPWIGVDEPLGATAVVQSTLLVNVLLVSWRWRVSLLPRDFSVPAGAARVWATPFDPAQAIAAVGLVLSVVGAVRLNNGASGGVAVVALVAAVLALGTLALRPGSMRRDLVTLGLVALGLLLATSLRGWSFTGHDIQAESLVYTLTNNTGHWQMSAFQNAYNACLSVTILPTIIGHMTGLSGPAVFKVIFPGLFALVPLMTFLLGRRFFTRNAALAGATLTLAFPTFFTDMPYLARQEIAFLFVGLLVLVATDNTASRGRARWAVVAFGAGIVLSHYSTTYFLILSMVGALVAWSLLRLAGRFTDRLGSWESPRGLVLLHPGVILSILAMGLMWAGPVTHSSGHAADVIRDAVKTVTGQGTEEQAKSSDTAYSLFGGASVTAQERLDELVAKTIDYREKKLDAADLLVPDPTKAEFDPIALKPAEHPVTAVGRAVEKTGVEAGILSNALRLAAAIALQVLMIGAVLWLLLRRREAGDHEAPDAAITDLSLMTVGSVGALVLVVVVPGLSVEYGVLRAFQQAMLVAAPAMGATLMWLFGRLPGRAAAAVAVLVPALLLAVLGGLPGALVGGSDPRIALSNSGTYYDRYFTSDTESEAIDWVLATDANDQYESRLIGNANVLAKLMVGSTGLAPVANQLFPTLLIDDSFVVVDSQILEEGRSTVFYEGDAVSYRYPLDVLDQKLNLVYSAPGVRIYR